jgi:demethylmenaquinone methyltransferase/2-methoxy-6-polyprenyl-1,4-benzoquinol methylase
MVADLATGSGDVALALRRRLPPACHIAALDFCEPMLEQARAKQSQRAIPTDTLSFRFGDCLNLPLADHSVDVVTIAFGLRNLEDRHRGLLEMRRVLRPGTGTLFVLEFSQPYPWFRPVYYAYLRFLLPFLAASMTGDRSAYQYLVGSIHAFPSREQLCSELTAAGFSSVKATALTGSAVAIHKGVA